MTTVGVTRGIVDSHRLRVSGYLDGSRIPYDGMTAYCAVPSPSTESPRNDMCLGNLRDIALAPDKFKGSLTAEQAGWAMAHGVCRHDPGPHRARLKTVGRQGGDYWRRVRRSSAGHRHRIRRFVGGRSGDGLGGRVLTLCGRGPNPFDIRQDCGGHRHRRWARPRSTG
jgi:hypothetical protein